MTKSDPDSSARRTLLFLQGLPGPSSATLGAALAARGHHVHRVNFNASDRLDWPLPNAVDFRGRAGNWPNFLDDLLGVRTITDILLFGDCRPLHQAAIRVARRRGVQVHVLEEGYVRPDWVTFEPGGVNGHSSLSRDPQWYFDQALRLPRAGAVPVAWMPMPQSQPPSFACRARAGLRYHTAAIIGAAAYPFYRTHRPWHPLAEAVGWARRLVHRKSERRRSDDARAWLHAQNRPYFLFPLQLDCDSQLRVHSPFGGLAAAIAFVLRSFADDAPPNTLLVVKQHPLENGLSDWRGRVMRAAADLAIADRVVFIEDGGLMPLAGGARGLVTVNSTSAMAALFRATPVAVLGTAVFALPGLVWSGPLASFWHDATPPDRRLFEAFCRVLQHRCLLRGDLLTPAGLATLAHGVVARIEGARTRPAAAHAPHAAMADLRLGPA